MEAQSIHATLEAACRRLVLIEPDAADAERLRQLLEGSAENPIELCHVNRVQDALPLLAQGGYHAVLLSLGLEGGDGLRAMARLRVAVASIPIIAVTQADQDAHALKAVRCGAEDYLSKGESDPQLVRRTVVHAIERCDTLNDLTQAREREHYAATHDALTDLPNRSAFLDQFNWSVARASRNGTQVALLLIDLDRFKTINDSLGHRIGDELLKVVAKRLLALLRKTDMVVRVGGDEFAVLLQDVKRVYDPARVAEKILDAVSRPCALLGREYRVTASIGIALFPGDGSDPDMLIRAGDMSMYNAKAKGRNRFSYYTEEMNAVVVNVLEVENGLRDAAGNESLLIHYQPQFHVGFEAAIGAEALLRWQRPGCGLVEPADFIGIAEETDLINRIGAWTLRTACEEAAGWPPWQGRLLKVAVNVSTRQLIDRDFVDFVARTLQETGLGRGRLDLEITETCALQEDAITVATLRQLRELGVAVVIDDLGTGYSSLSALKTLPVDGVKIDRSFISEVMSDPAVATITEGIISIARGLDLQVVAEGVETRDQFAFLRSFGCQVMQGYLFAKPVEAAELRDCLAASDNFWATAS